MTKIKLSIIINIKTMSKLFLNHEINLEEGTVYSKRLKRLIGVQNGEYLECRTHDIYGNLYSKIHQMILAEGLDLPKHLWPVDKKGQRFEADHIIPLSNGGDNSFSNLRLVSKKDNSNNPQTKLNQSSAAKNKIYTDECAWRKHLSEALKKAFKEGRRTVSQKFIDGGQRLIEKKKKPIYQYRLDLDLVAIYSDGHTAARETGFNRERIRFHCLDGNSYKGFLWSYTPLV